MPDYPSKQSGTESTLNRASSVDQSASHHHFSGKTMALIAGLAGMVVIGFVVFASSQYGQNLLGFKITSLFSGAAPLTSDDNDGATQLTGNTNTATTKNQGSTRCVQEPCDQTGSTNQITQIKIVSPTGGAFKAGGMLDISWVVDYADGRSSVQPVSATPKVKIDLIAVKSSCTNSQLCAQSDILASTTIVSGADNSGRYSTEIGFDMNEAHFKYNNYLSIQLLDNQNSLVGKSDLFRLESSSLPDITTGNPIDGGPPINPFTAPKIDTTYDTASGLTISWKPESVQVGPDNKVTLYVGQWPACLYATPPCRIMEREPYKIAEVTNTGSYKWSVPENFPAPYIGTGVNLKMTTSTGKYYISGTFTLHKVLENKPVVTYPKSGGKYTAGNALPVNWDTSVVTTTANPTVTLVLGKWPDCVLVKPACQPLQVASLPIGEVKNIGSYSWDIPSTIPTTLLNTDVRMKVLTTGGVAYYSDSFTIEAKPVTSSFILPKAKDVYNATDMMTIQYSYQSASGSYKPGSLVLRVPGGFAAETSYTVKPVAATTDNFKWPIPSNLPESLRNNLVILSLTDADGKYVLSSEAFTILSTEPQPTVSAHPAGSLVKGLDGIPTSVSLIVSENGKIGRRGFPNEAVFMSRGYKWEKIVPANSADQALPSFGAVSMSAGSLVIDSALGEVCVIYPGEISRCFDKWSTLTAMGYGAIPMYLYNPKDYQRGMPITQVEAHAPGSDVINGNTGAIYYVESPTSLKTYPSMEVFNTWQTRNNDLSRVVKMNSFDLAVPITGNANPRF